jgi:hypothetical protein
VLGALASLGIVKGQPFEPDERRRAILSEAATVGTAAGRTLDWRPTWEGEQDWAFYPQHLIGRPFHGGPSGSSAQSRHIRHHAPTHGDRTS